MKDTAIPLSILPEPLTVFVGSLTGIPILSSLAQQCQARGKRSWFTDNGPPRAWH
jgi:hypothetical protein